MLEGFWIRNYKSLRQVGIGIGFPQLNYVDDETAFLPYELDNVTLFAGASGTGKSSVVDAFMFVSDCYKKGVDFACLKRGGYEALYSQGGKGAMSFGFHYRQQGEVDTVTYALSIARAKNNAPYIESELLAYRRGRESVPVFFLQNGVKSIRYLAPHEKIGNAELTAIEFTDYKHLGLEALESHPRFPVLASLRNLFETWVLGHFTMDPARGLDASSPRKHESPRGVSLSGVVRYMLQHYGDGCEELLKRVAGRIPNVDSILLDKTNPEKPLLSFKMSDMERPVPITLLSDAAVRLFAYALLLEEDAPAPLIMLEEPENGLDHLHGWKLSELLVQKGNDPRPQADFATQLFVTSHDSGVADMLHPAQVWLFQKNIDGFTVVERASDTIAFESSTVEESAGPDAPVEPHWFSNRFEEKL